MSDTLTIRASQGGNWFEDDDTTDQELISIDALSKRLKGVCVRLDDGAWWDDE